jgi:Nucleotide modification associated domain 3
MKIIFSKKGFDSAFGKSPSPILPSGEMVSLPIPTDQIEGAKDYHKIWVDKNISYDKLMVQLHIPNPQKNGQFLGCHLDPDLRSSIIPRAEGWKPIFGQSGNDTTHLIETGKVEKGDLFLFYGTFKKTIYDIDNQLIFDDDYERHIIWGWLLVDDIWNLGEVGIDNFKNQNPHYRWAFDHPHFSYIGEKRNAIFVSSDQLRKDSNRKGAGVFKYNDSLSLTKLGYKLSVWELPSFFNPENVTISHTIEGIVNKNKKIEKFRKADSDKVIWQIASGYGQEFVITPKNSIADKQIQDWAFRLIEFAQVYD